MESALLLMALSPGSVTFPGGVMGHQAVSLPCPGGSWDGSSGAMGIKGPGYPCCSLERSGQIRGVLLWGLLFAWPVQSGLGDEPRRMG